MTMVLKKVKIISDNSCHIHNENCLNIYKSLVLIIKSDIIAPNMYTDEMSMLNTSKKESKKRTRTPEVAW